MTKLDPYHKLSHLNKFISLLKKKKSPNLTTPDLSVCSNMTNKIFWWVPPSVHTG